MTLLLLYINSFDQELIQSNHLVDSSLNLFLCFLITNDALENNLSAGTEVAGIERKSRAIFDKAGYSVSCVLHHAGEETLVVYS